MALGLARLEGRAQSLNRGELPLQWIRRPSGLAKLVIWALSSIYISCSFFVVFSLAATPTNATIPGWVVPTIVFSILMIGVLYYFLFFFDFVSRGDTNPMTENNISRSRSQRLSLFRFAGVDVSVTKDDNFEASNERARRFGSRRIITYKVCPIQNYTYETYMKLMSSPVHRSYRPQLLVLVFWWNKIRQQRMGDSEMANPSFD